ncbi:hypothetical protein KJ765_01225 [Candidatus Micrarchaeota archaeon]|nr:hypothetical protein [Candidatus Micrarchaeota archaeon]
MDFDLRQVQEFGKKGWYNKHYSGLPITLSSIAKGIATPLEDVGWSMRFSAWFFRENMFNFYWGQEDMERVRQYVLEHNDANSKFAVEIIQRWERQAKKVHEKVQKLERRPLETLSDEQFIHETSQLNEMHAVASYLPHIADSFLETGETSWAHAALEKDLTGVPPTERGTTIEALCRPTELTFVRQEYAELVDVARKREDGSQEEFEAALEAHAHKWQWIENNYRKGSHLNTAYFQDKLNRLTTKELAGGTEVERKRLHRVKEKKAEILERNGKRAQNLIFLLERFGVWQDARKKMNLHATQAWFRIRDELVRRTALSEDEANYLCGDEVEKALNGTIEKETLAGRKTHGLALMGLSEKLLKWTGNEMRRAESLFETVETETDEIKGVIASKGFAKGRAVLLLNLHAMARVKQGDVIVSNQTTPEYVPALKKAAAIVTDQGGLTCHAAIISRELGIPAVIGTRIASRVFHEGDVLEVDAVHGVVRRIRNPTN